MLEISTSERNFLRNSSKTLLADLIWRDKSNIRVDPFMGVRSGSLSLTANQRANRAEVDVTKSFLAELMFSIYKPQELGVIDYHGPHRTYNRELLGAVNLTIDATDERSRQHALYNYSNKYANLKSEMASAYVRHLLAKQAAPSLPSDDS